MKLSTIFGWIVGLFRKKRFYKKPLCGVEFFDPLNSHLEAMSSISLKKFARLYLNEVRVHLRGRRGGTNPYRHPFKFENGKYNLDKWDGAFWENLKKFVKKCKSKGIHVTIELMNHSEFKGTYDSKFHSPWYALNNVNGYVKSNSHSSISKGIFVAQGPAIEKIKLMTSKLLTIVGDYPNVMLHMGNEPYDGDIYGYHNTLIDYIRNDRKWKGKICVNLMNERVSGTDAQILSLQPNYVEYHCDYNMFKKGKVEAFINNVRRQFPKITPIIATDGAKDLNTKTIKEMAEFCLARRVGFRYWKHTDSSGVVWDYIKAVNSVYKRYK